MELIARWQISAGEVSTWLPPLLYAAAVVVSAWVLSDARRRGFRLYAVALWTLATLISPPVVFPLYLITRIFTQKHDATPQPLEASTSLADTEAVDSTAHASSSGDAGEQTDAVSSVAASSPAGSPEEIHAP
ncbi:MAG TPA: hypothetical protein VGO96_10735, partial [Pyrinomonadaceae bacterium]|nr:hypothetical protein [Pyrinomonadaceae bacterium]